MFILYILIAAPLIQNGFTIIPVETDLNLLLSSNYDENFENWDENSLESGNIIFDTITPEILQEICKNNKLTIYIKQEDIQIDCQTLNNKDIVKRSITEQEEIEEGSGHIEPEINNTTTTIKIDTNTVINGAIVKEMEQSPEAISDKEQKFSHKDAEIYPHGRNLQNTRKNEESIQDNAVENQESIKTRQSIETPKKAGSKDTTILIVLFVAVVIVGLLAFGYNFVKKRKQQHDDLERVEKGPASALKRSLQNLNKPDGEVERKPLINENSKEVEMVNMKKEPLVEDENKVNGN